MSLAQCLQTAWQRQSKWLLLLRPFSVLYRALFVLNRGIALKLKTPYQAPVPLMVIGNITVGGSGKTPLLIALVRHLQQCGIRVGVISRGYGGLGPFPCMVTAQSGASQVGDEPCLIVQATQVPMAVGANRKASIELLLQQHALDLIISDDGLQHWALARDIEWIVVDRNRGFGNERLLPEGFLREPISRLAQSTVIEHTTQPSSELSMQLQLGQPYLLFSHKHQHNTSHARFDPTQTFHAVVGIGFPERFFQSLKQLGVTQFLQHAFADHHAYQAQELQFHDDLAIITTEKDAVKLKALWLNPESAPLIWVLPVQAQLSPACYSLLHQQLQAKGIARPSESSL